MIDFNDLRQANVERTKQWDPFNTLSLEFKTIELCGEVGEAANAIKKYLRTKAGITGGTDSIEPIAEELADVVICVDLLAERLGINLAEAVCAKFNKTSNKYGLATKLPEKEPRDGKA